MTLGFDISDVDWSLPSPFPPGPRIRAATDDDDFEEEEEFQEEHEVQGEDDFDEEDFDDDFDDDFEEDLEESEEVEYSGDAAAGRDNLPDDAEIPDEEFEDEP